MGCETTYAFIYRAAPTGRAVITLSTRRHTRRRPSQDIIEDREVRSDRTRAAQVHHFRLRPARLAANHAPAMTTRFLRCLCLVGQGRGRKPEVDDDAGLPRQTSTKCPTKKAGEGATTYSVASSEGFLLGRLHRRPSRAVPIALTLCALGSFVETQAPKPIFPCHQPVS